MEEHTQDDQFEQEDFLQEGEEEEFGYEEEGGLQGEEEEEEEDVQRECCECGDVPESIIFLSCKHCLCL